MRNLIVSKVGPPPAAFFDSVIRLSISARPLTLTIDTPPAVLSISLPTRSGYFTARNPETQGFAREMRPFNAKRVHQFDRLFRKHRRRV